MKYFIKKLVTLVITLFFVSIITFGVFQILPGDPVLIMLGVDADPAQAEQLRQQLGLNDPLISRYFNWVGGFVKGDLGTSYKYSLPVSDLIKQRIQPTVILAIFSILITIVIGVPVGIWLARHSDKVFPNIISGLTQLGLSIPGFWIGIILILIFAVNLGIMPSGGYTPWEANPGKCLKTLTLPAIALSFGTTATIIRYLKNTLLDNINMDYVRTARSKGLTEKAIVYKHVLRNALIPVITMLAMLVTDILAGSIIMETVFSIPGLGSLMTTSISSRDFPLLQSAVMYVAAIVVIINTIVDILYGIIDPRIRVK